jgi:hypothetical protein
MLKLHMQVQRNQQRQMPIKTIHYNNEQKRKSNQRRNQSHFRHKLLEKYSCVPNKPREELYKKNLRPFRFQNPLLFHNIDDDRLPRDGLNKTDAATNLVSCAAR